MVSLEVQYLIMGTKSVFHVANRPTMANCNNYIVVAAFCLCMAVLMHVVLCVLFVCLFTANIPPYCPSN